ncbi:beta-lactamase class C [Zymomonas mobilis]|uniref:serine hydrolase domain-containing protein n=1 Tax=Zymomonas mobilis TaxID=542 RepID=UPI00026D8110|nr:serine hydrolase domain-containing protein [Zymomonas mobilis]AFN56990.1 beta-lactamase [Zymomonas mobilis subsp. mobilis ATCC 29191]TQK77572.1 beta-lactamase class C [Zymomonas mobilis]TQL15776.1 beta-lactamase class C [Zymomonas mobilis]
MKCRTIITAVKNLRRVKTVYCKNRIASLHKIALKTGTLLTAFSCLVPSMLRAAEPVNNTVVQTLAPPEEGTSIIDYQKIDQRLNRLMESQTMVGLGVVIVENGKIRFVRGYGVRRAGGHAAVTPNTVFRWASLSKGVASTLVNLLADQKRLSIDDIIARYSTSLRLPEHAEQQATIRMLLSQRLGLVHNAYDDRLEHGEDPATLRQNLDHLHLSCSVGQCYGYQNVAFDTAHEIVERVTGMSYAQAVRRYLFLPLGMYSASIGRNALVNSADWAEPHVWQHTREVKENYYRIPAAGGVNSSILDLGRWMRAQMGMDPETLSPSLLNRIHQPQINTGTWKGGPVDHAMDDAAYAMAFRVYHYRGHLMVGHRGAVSGYRSLLLFDPKLKSGVAALWNSESPRPTGLQLEVMDMLYHQPFHDWMELDTPDQTPLVHRAAHPISKKERLQLERHHPSSVNAKKGKGGKAALPTKENHSKTTSSKASAHSVVTKKVVAADKKAKGSAVKKPALAAAKKDKASHKK